MSNQKKCAALKIAAFVTYIAVIDTAALELLVPIGGLTPKEVSEAYPNLFMPAEPTFFMMALIVLLLAAYTVFQLFAPKEREELICRVNFYFSVISAAHVFWVFAWHFRLIPLTVFFRIIMVLALIMIIRVVTAGELTMREAFFIKLPFAVCLGWITMMTVLNITVLLVSLGVNGFSEHSQSVTVVTFAACTILGMWTGIRFRSTAYLLTLLWAYAGILLRHVSASGLNKQYPRIVHTIVAGIVLLMCTLVGMNAAVRWNKRQDSKKSAAVKY